MDEMDKFTEPKTAQWLALQRTGKRKAELVALMETDGPTTLDVVNALQEFIDFLIETHNLRKPHE